MMDPLLSLETTRVDYGRRLLNAARKRDARRLWREPRSARRRRHPVAGHRALTVPLVIVGNWRIA